MPTLLKGWCVHCRGDINGPVDQPAAAVQCPHCGREMAISAAVAYRERFHPNRRWLWAVIGLVTVILLATLGYLFRRPLKSGFYLLADETGGTTAALVCLAVALLVLVLAALWMVLPILLYIGLKDLRRRTSELNETGKLCALHLARLADPRTPPDRPADSKGEG